MLTLILFTVIIPFFLLKELTRNFDLLKNKKGTILGLVFVIGVYFYATGNGAHEIASYLFNSFCPIKTFSTRECQSMFFNDYCFGNILYFLGAFLMNISLFVFERIKPSANFSKKDLTITAVNSLVYAFAIFAYAAFDRVLVGLIYSLISMIVTDVFLLSFKKGLRKIPFAFYLALSYTIATVTSLVIRLH